MHEQYVQYGAGMCGPAEWKNFDVSPTLRLQRFPVLGLLFKRFEPKFPPTVSYGDIVRGLPLEEDSCDAIYCSHTLEHLSLGDFRTALRKTFAHLKNGGRFRFVLPDLEKLAKDYLSSEKPSAATDFMRLSYLGKETRPRGLQGLLRIWLGNSAHLSMWDYKSIELELADVGFIAIRRAEFGDSEDPMFAHVEDPDRWSGCLGVDCLKPRGTYSRSE